jgi:phosphatidate cytidylyltransferase
MKDLLTRLPTTAALILFAYATIRFLPRLPFSLLVYVIASLAAVEFLRLAGPAIRSLPLILTNGLIVAALFTFPQLPVKEMLAATVILNGLFFLFAVRRSEQLPTFVHDFGVHLAAVFYIFLPLYFMYDLHQLHPNYLFFLILVIAIGDSGAYFVGVAIGRHKIYPVASPKKSLEGLIAAVLTAAPAGWLSLWLFPLPIRPPTAILSAALVGLVSQLSDPVESLFKRAAGAKDSGTLLPGHGGVLDRIDSYIFCAPLLAALAHIVW